MRGFAAAIVAALVVALAGSAGASQAATVICPPPPCVASTQIVCPLKASAGSIATYPCGCPIALETQAIPIPIDGNCADLSVTVSVDRATAVVGDRLTYTIEVRNAGPDTATDVTVSDPLPPGLALVSTSGTSLGALGPGEAATATVVARAAQAGEIANAVTASTSAVDLDPSNNQATATTRVDPSRAGSPPKPPALLTSWCSPSGDVCYGRVRGRGPLRLGLTLAARYFKRYMLCVTAPAGTTTCHRFRVHRRNPGTWGSTVRWRARFPDKGKGTYRVTWSTRSGALGPPISFTRP